MNGVYNLISVHTGEEDEVTLHQVRGKLFVMESTNQWKERGVGLLKLNVRKDDRSGARLSLFLCNLIATNATDDLQSCEQTAFSASY